MGVVGLYELGARDIFAFLADVKNCWLSPNSNICKQSSPTLKFIAGNYTISLTRGSNSRSGKTINRILISLIWRKDKSPSTKIFMTLWFAEEPKESLLKIRLIPSLPDLMQFSKLLSRRERKFLAKFHLLIWLEINEELITQTWRSKLGSMGQKLTNHCFLWKSVLGHWTRERAIHHFGVQNLQWFWKIHL